MNSFLFCVVAVFQMVKVARLQFTPVEGAFPELLPPTKETHILLPDAKPLAGSGT